MLCPPALTMTRSDAAIEPHLRSHPKEFPLDPKCPFPVGVEYYRAPVPPTKFWDEDLARIRAAGMCIIRTFTSGRLVARVTVTPTGRSAQRRTCTREKTCQSSMVASRSKSPLAGYT